MEQSSSAPTVSLLSITVIGILLSTQITSAEYTAAEPVKEKLQLKMPGLHPTQDEQYWCYAFTAPRDVRYITQYKAIGNGDAAHHMLLFGCSSPLYLDKPWICGMTCKDNAKIMFGWAKYAPPTTVPEGVGYEIGGQSELTVRYLVLQVHYKEAFSANTPPDYSGVELLLSAVTPIYRAGMGLLLSNSLLIPPNREEIVSDMSCQYQGRYPIYPFGYRTHAHSLGKIISGYSFNGSWHLIGKGSPQWPQAFYPVAEPVAIKTSDYLVARCVFDSTGRNVETNIGSTSADEMCNFYFMFYTNFSSSNLFVECVGNQQRAITKDLPPDTLVPPPANYELEEAGKGHAHHHHEQGEPAMNTMGGQGEEKVSLLSGELVDDGDIVSWSPAAPPLGQVGGVAYDQYDNLYVFHRDTRVWDENSFDDENYFTQDQVPINVDTILKFAPNGTLLDHWGQNMFFMPHGIYVDMMDNVWVTDVALHQVMKFPCGEHLPSLTLGVKFEPGADSRRFCKPSGVVVVADGTIIVADGYCNSRVVSFTSEGEFIREFGQHSTVVGEDGYAMEGSFDLVHSITNIDRHKMVCVADRLNSRAQCFTYSGQFLIQIHPPELNKLPVYAVQYCSHMDSLVILTGVGYDDTQPTKVYFVSMKGQVLWQWAPPQGFTKPHTLAVNINCTALAVGEIGPNLLWKVHTQGHSSVSDTNMHQSVVKRPGVGLFKPHPHQAVDSSNGSVSDEVESEESSQDLGVSIIIASLLVVPILIVIVVILLLRVKKRVLTEVFVVGSSSRKNRRFDVGQFLGRDHKGFSRLSTEDEGGELDPLNSATEDEDGEEQGRKV